MIVLTTFKSVRDNVPHLVTHDSWNAFADDLERQSKITGTDKGKTACLSPAIYETGKTRSKPAAMAWNWCGFDIDNKDGNEPGSSIADIAAKCVDYTHIIYTTTSSRDGSDCFRLLLPLSRMVEAEEFEAFWQSAAQWLGCVDQQTKDISRLFVAPRTWPETNNSFHRHDAATLDVDALRQRYPVKIAPAPARTLVSAFDNAFDLKEPEVADINLYGPFVSEEALSKAQGPKTKGGGRMFAFLVSVATRGMLKGYNINEVHLEDIAHQLASLLGRETTDICHDARNALVRARSHYASARAEKFLRLNPQQAYLDKWCKR